MISTRIERLVIPARTLRAVLAGFLILVATGTLAWGLYTYNTPVDLQDVFLPTARHVLAGGNPYDMPGFYGPPWALIPALLVARLPDRAAYAAHGVLSIAALLTFLYLQKVPGLKAIPLLLSVPVLCGVLCGNLEPFVLLALVVPRPAGLILLAMKPHIGCVLAFYWVLDEARERGAEGIFKLLWPTCALTAATIGLYGFWPVAWLEAADACAGWNWNVWGMSPWWHVIALGIPLSVLALYEKREDMALSAGPILSPYTNVYGFTSWLPFMTTWPAWATWAMCLLTWLLLLTLAIQT